jgi:amino acid adenylation domain-containing protein
MSMHDLFSRLNSRGITLELDNGELEVNAPRSKLTPDILSELREKKEEIIQFLQKHVQKQETFISIERAHHKEHYVLSSAQKRLYILHQMMEGSTGYNISGAMKLTGALDREKLEETFRRLIQRHDSLRTSFHTVEDQPVQKIHDYVAFNIEYFDLTLEEGQDHIQDRTLKIIDSFIRSFDLSQPPLLRVSLLRESHQNQQNHILLVDMHHIISDGTSLAIFAKDFMSIYGEEGLPPLKIQYKDYSEWQMSHKQLEAMKEQEDYWLSQFDEEIPILELPADFVRPSTQSFEGDSISFEIAKEKTEAIRALTRETGSTMYIVLLALHNIFLSKLSNQEDIVIGSPIAGRGHADLEKIIGMFVNTLALRNNPSGHKTFTQFLHEVKQKTLQTFENQGYQYDYLVEQLAIERDASRNPLFDSMLVFQNTGNVDLDIPGLKLSPYKYQNKTSKVDLTLNAIESDEKLSLSFEYCAKLFKEESIHRFVNYFLEITAAVLENPGNKLSEIEILSNEEKRRILFDFNETVAVYPREKTIHQLFEEQVERFSEQCAVISGPMRITYAELNQRANQFAHELQEKGVGPETIVAIKVERSIEMIIGIFGILKAGGAYLPIAMDYPPERIDFILKDSNAALLLTEGDITESSFETGNPQPATRKIGASDLAYIIYTSGSTGRPKGVLVEHRAVINTLYAVAQAYPFGESDVYLLKTAFTFDVSVTELFGWFQCGGALAILEKGGEKDLQIMLDTIEAASVTHINFVPSMFNAFTAYLQQYGTQRISKLKYIFLAGEALQPDAVNRFRSLNTAARLENIYGPTEAAIYASWYSLADWNPGTSVPIGKPLPNVQLYILNEKDRLQPIGVSGELCIGGAGLSRGYLNRQELTAEKFVHLTIDTQHVTLYRTGDLARWLPDGNITFLGRIDHQVKIRGFRIELGEIETQLLKNQDINEAVVIVRTDKNGDNYLVAYIASGTETDPTKLRDGLYDSLPEYMIPSYFVPIEVIPLTTSGKLNRKALPDVELTREQSYTAPGNDIEKELVEIWSDLLGRIPEHVSQLRESLGIHANFFDMGGHSLKATILISRIYKAFDVHISLGQLFKTPTIKGLADYIQNAAQSKFISIKTGEKKEYYALSSAQQRLYILQQFELKNTGYNIPNALYLSEDISADAAAETFRKLISRHESLRASFQLISETPVQKIHDDVELLLDHYEGDLEQCVREFVRPFDLSQAPLIRAALLKVSGSGDRLLLIDMHHIITDGVSQGILRKEFTSLYFEENLLPLKLQYKDYSQWQQQFLESEVSRNQKEYWIKEFAAEIPVLNLPWDYSRPANQSFEGSSVSFELSAAETNALNEIARKEETTLFMVMLVIYNIFLYRLSSQEDIVVGVPIAGRRHIDLEKIIGMFVNTLPLRNRLAEEKTFVMFLKELREKTLEAFENQDYQFENIVEDVAVERDMSRNPLFDVMLTFQNMNDSAGPEDETTELKIKSYELKRQASKVDLHLTAFESKGKFQFTLTYCTRLFNENTIQRFINYFLKIISSVIQNPGNTISEIEFIPDEEKRRILFDFNETETTYPRDKTIRQLFEEQVERFPKHKAVISRQLSGNGVTHITYGELNIKAGQVAALLQEKGVGPNTIVAIMIEPSLEMMIGKYAILKAGGAYLPMDPEFPKKRLNYILADTQSRIILTQTTFMDTLKWFGELINLEDSAIYNGGSANLTRLSAPGDILYTIYTSGTSGKPKGVLVKNENMVNYVSWFTKKTGLTGQDKAMLISSFAYDLGYTALYTSILAGGELHLTAKEVYLDMEILLNYVKEHKITYLKMTPSLFSVIVGSPEFLKQNLASLRLVVLGGEAIDTKDVEHAYQTCDQLQIMNHYGPTETTIGSVACFIDFDRIEAYHQKPTIGKPIHNTKIFILDKNSNPAPIGVAAELCIGGNGVSRGYLNQPELTAEKFFKLAHNNQQVTLYKTGDLACWLPDGNIQFLGRIDHQVKIRGFRIELGEVEKHLLDYPDIDEAVAIIADNINGEKSLCAYIVSNRELLVAELRDYLLTSLPHYMIPSHFIKLEKIPLNPNGKIDRKALNSVKESLKTSAEYAPPDGEVEEKITEIWKETLGLEKISIYDNFFELGGNSLQIITINNKMKKVFESDIPMAKMFSYPTIRSLGNYLSKNEADEITSDKKITKSVAQMAGSMQLLKGDITAENETIGKNTDTGLEIAVIGMSGRFPGARNLHEYWENLKNGVESITFLSAEELDKLDVPSELVKDPGYVKAGGVLEKPEYFDASFFGYTPAEAEIMNPQMRIFHECAWHTLEDAGYNLESYDGLIGLYAGASSSFQWEGLSILSGKRSEVGGFVAAQLTNIAFLSTRISYRFNLKGPSSNVQTACSTSLVAIHMACRSILNGDCDMALAGGIGININQKNGYLYQDGMILSPDGHSRAFDARAKGTLGGSGVGIVLLKQLKNAIADRDHIYAIVKGSAINNDGSRKVGYAAPSVQGQVDVIRTAQAMSRIETDSIGYVETHGTATPLGDPVELEALTRAFNTDKRNYCPIGSVKTNIGHLDAGAGIAGFIKTVLALKNKAIPPSLHFEEPNPKIDFKNSPFYINTELSEWKNDKYPLRAGVSSFGIGGTNAHVILEETPAPQNSQAASVNGGYQIIPLSAKTPSALNRMSQNLADYLSGNPGVNLADMAYTLQVGRQVFQHRRLSVCSDAGDVIEALSSEDSGKVRTAVSKEGQRSTIFMFAGLGSQYVNMGADLYRHEPEFRIEMDRCFAILKSLDGPDLKPILYPAAEVVTADESAGLNHFETAQLAVFVLEYSLANLIMNCGVNPHAMIGYSFGEYTAACLSGVFSLEDALKLMVARGRLVAKVPTGTMLSAPLTANELKPFLNEEIAIAIDNGPSCILAGPDQHLDALQDKLKAKRYLCMRLTNSHAIHSPMMTPILKEFEKFLRTVAFNKPQIPYISNVTGKWITHEEAADPRYWCKHLSQTVRFAEGVDLLKKKPNPIFIEIGPGRDLSTLLVRYKEKNLVMRSVNLIRPSQQDITDNYYLLKKIGQLWLYGVSVDWKKFHGGEERRRIPLPPYPFEGKKYWLIRDSLDLDATFVQGILNGDRKTDIADWYYIPSWKRTPLTTGNLKHISTLNPSCWLLFVDKCGIGNQLLEELKKSKQRVITVHQGIEFSSDTDTEFTIQPHHDSDYEALFCELSRNNNIPDKIVHLWGVTGGNHDDNALEPTVVDAAQNLGFFSLLNIAWAMGKEELAKSIEITVVTDNMQEVNGEDGLWPGKATVLGLVRAIPNEFPNIKCRSIDLSLSKKGSTRDNELARQLFNELTGECFEPVVAYRNFHRWEQSFESIRLEKPREKNVHLRQEGVYLVTGGLGGIGLLLAEHLAKTMRAKLVLTGRSSFPAKEEWEPLLNRDVKEEYEIKDKIRRLKMMEDNGAEVLVLSADVTDEKQMRSVIDKTLQKFSRLNGVIHSAGLPDGELIRRKKRKNTGKILAAKVSGTLLLDRILKDIELDFFMLCSSTASIQAGIGQAGYCAANNFLDAFAKYKFYNQRLYTVAVNWNRWRQTGMATIGEDMHKNLTGEEMAGGMSLEQGIEAFNSILDETLPQVVVTPLDPNRKFTQPREVDVSSLMENIDESNFSQLGHKRPELETEYIAPRYEMEHKIAGIWAKFFGFQQVGVQDDFFDLGGDSLRAMVIASKIHKELNIEIPIQEFFNSPTIEGLAGYIDHDAQKNVFVSIEPAEEKEFYPLSSAQKRLYIVQQMELDSKSYNQPGIFILDGELDKDRFKEVFRELIKRHEGLRTSFHMIKGEPVQKIHDEVKFEIEYFDAGQEERLAQDPTNFESTINRFVRPFDLSIAPLLRVGLLEIESQKHLIMVDTHHVIADGISMEIFRGELMAIYGQVELLHLCLRYRDFSEWQNQGKENREVKQQETFWLKEFEGEIPVLNLPWDFQRPVVQSFAGSVITFELSAEETQALNEMAQKERATLFMTLLAIYNIFLSKLSGQEDIVVGVPIAGRKHIDLKRIIGMFVNTLPLRNEPSGEKIFASFLKELKERTLEAFENQYYQFENIVDEVAVERDMGRNPLFDAMLTLQNITDAPGPEAIPEDEMAGPKIRPYLFERKTSKVDLDLSASESKGKIIFTLTYCSKLFKENTIQRFINYFLKIISSVIENPGNNISDLQILSDEEKRRVLFDFNGAETEYPKDKTIHRIFEQQVERFSDQCSVVNGNSQLTYGELDQRANQLALVLQEKGVGPDTIVAITAERSIEMIIGIIGILKAGGAYLPIDPVYPQERIEYMLKDSNATLLLTGNDLKVIGEPKDRSNAHAATETVNATNIAYIIYTSGSTGKPKGVMVEHYSAVNLGCCQQETFRVNERDRILQFSSLCFDASVEQILIALFSGAALILVDKETLLTPAQFESYISRQAVTHIHAVPAFLNTLTPGKYNNLKRVIAGGDICPASLAKHWAQDYEFYNEYGPTETTVTSIEMLVDPQTAALPQLPVGRPLHNTQVYILDKWMNTVPFGIIGEMYIGGEGVTRGYLNRPELTDETFVTSQTLLANADIPNARLYKTGDLARWLPDGNLEFLGRTDHQVKIRGFRIELGEIESRILEYPDIKEVVVIYVDDKNGNNYLCAYIVSALELLAVELREFLTKFLPDYMIPSQFFQVEKIPLTPSGKIDRKAMSSVKDAMKSGVEYAPPSGEVEEKITEIWKEILGLEKIGINDNFFEIGGNSLQIITINNEMKKIFEDDIPVVIMFSYPTIRSLANYLSKNEADEITPEEKIEESVVLMEEAIQLLLGDQDG